VLAVGTIGNLTAGGMLEVALPALAHTTLAAGASGYGIMLAGFGAGAMIGGIGAGGLGRLPHRGMTALLLGILQAVAFAVLPFTRGLAGSVLLLVVAGVTNGLGNIFFITMLQRQLPRHLLGRIMGVLMFCVFGLYPLSVAGAGVVVGHFGPVIIFPASGLAMVFAIAFGLLQRELRSL
jgi:hypothetical protein